jgi:uncharacterized membrane protein YcaP (DUF421 family)
VLRGAAVYLFLVILFRIAGKRALAQNQGIGRLSEIAYAGLELNGEISVIPAAEESKQ